MKQAGYATSKDAIRNYIEWAKDSWLLFSIPIFSDSLKEQERNYKKIYAIDWALANKNSQIWDGGQSRALESLAATANYFETKINLIITYNQEKAFSIDGVNIKAVPAWKWLLE